MQDWGHFVNSLPIVGCHSVEEALCKTKENGNVTTKA